MSRILRCQISSVFVPWHKILTGCKREERDWSGCSTPFDHCPLHPIFGCRVVRHCNTPQCTIRSMNRIQSLTCSRQLVRSQEDSSTILQCFHEIQAKYYFLWSYINWMIFCTKIWVIVWFCIEFVNKIMDPWISGYMLCQISGVCFFWR